MPQDDGHNALFLRWLTEFTVDATTDNQVHALNKAIRSLRTHKQPIHDPKELIHLKFFGPKIVKRLREQFSASTVSRPAPSAPRNAPVDRLLAAPVHDGQQPFCFTYCDHRQLAVPSQPSAHTRINQELQTLEFAVLFRANSIPTAQTAGVTDIQPAASERFKDEPDTYHGYLPETSGHASRTTSSLLPPLPLRPRTTDPIRGVPVASVRTSSEHRTRTPPPSSQGLASTSRTIIAPAAHLSQWPPHTYDIVCLVDSREVKNAKARDDIVNGLRNLGVLVQRCSLELGDFVWIARRKQAFVDTPDGGQIANQVVLDFIVERKRLDDLVTSIKDGRFHEQKFRLKASGLANVFFVIETSQKDKNETVKRFEPSTNTAITSTQIVDGFFVHQTKDTDATVKLLKVLHDAVCHKYRDEPLWIIPHQTIHRDTFAQLQRTHAAENPRKTILILYKSFCMLNAKSTFQVARECFAKQLLCIRGMSAERVSFVVDEYGTIRALWEAFRQARIEEERMIMAEAEERVAYIGNSNGTRPKKRDIVKAELLLADLGKGRRRIGKELSSKIYDLFMKDQYDD